MELYPLEADESIELRAFRAGGQGKSLQRFLPSWDDLYAEAEQIDEDYDVYFGVAPRVPDSNGKLQGTAANVKRIPVVWLDADEREGISKRDRLDQIEEWKPTYIVDSGHGFHVYFVLAESAHPFRARDFMSALSTQLDCDKTSDPARILRVPGTLNHKNPEDRRFVELISNGGPVHYLADLENQLSVPIERDISPQNLAFRVSLIEQFGLDKGSSEMEGERFDGRDRGMFDVALYYHGQGWDYERILQHARIVNTKNRPPLPEKELIKKVQSATRYEAPLQVLEVIEAASTTTPSVTPRIDTTFSVQSLQDIRTYEEPPTEWMAQGVLARGHIVYTMNPPKSGKTTVALNLGLRMAAGKSGAGLWIEEQYRTLFLQPMGDMHPSLTREWTRKISDSLDLPSNIPFELAILGERHDHFKYLQERGDNYDLVIVDTISRLFPAVDDKDTRTVSEELDKIRRLRMMYPDTCWLYLVQVGKNSLVHAKGSNPGFAARGNSAIAEVFDDALQIIVPNNDIERDEDLGLNLTRHLVMMGRGAAQYRKPWRTRFNPETHVIDWVQDMTYDEAVEDTPTSGSSKPTQSRLAADLLGRLFLDAKEATGQPCVLATDVYRIGEENGFSKRVMKLALEMRDGRIDPSRGPKAAWWDGQIEVVE